MSLDEPTFDLALAGDVAPSRRLRPESSDVSQLLQEADAAFANMEAPIVDKSVPATGIQRATYLRTRPQLLDDLLGFGFDIFAAGSNHTGDFLHEGMRQTMREFETRDVPYAGLGRSLQDARAPAYLDTPDRRVGLVAVTNEFENGEQAGTSRHSEPPRPGVAPLRTSVVHEVPSEQLDLLRKIDEATGLSTIKSSLSLEDSEDEHLLVNLGGGDNLGFVASEEPGLTRQLDRDDLTAFAEQVDSASRRCHLTIASIHMHAGSGGTINDHSVADALELTARVCVESGADVVVCHGPHVLRGIDVVDGVPVFYSLGDFAVQEETLEEYPAEMYESHGLDPEADPTELMAVLDEDPKFPGPMISERERQRGVLPICSFGDETTIRLYPLDMDDEKPYARGTPKLADGPVATEILERLQEYSGPYGTEIRREGEVGYIEV